MLGSRPTPMALRPRVGPLARAVVAGAVGGAAGTLAMSAVMLAAGAAGLMGRQPPRIVVDRAADAAAADPDEGERDAGASVIHLLIGAASGIALVASRRAASAVAARPVAAVPFGAAFGLVLWAINYVAIAPALGLLPPPPRDRPTRPPVMVAAHLVFGVSAAMLADRVRRVGTRRAGH